MTILQLDGEIKSIVDNYHVYGVECIFTSLLTACRDKQYLEPDVLRYILEHAIKREQEDPS